MKGVDIPLGGVVLLENDVTAEPVRGRDRRAAALARVVECVLIHFAGCSVVDDIAHVDVLVLRPQPRVDPESGEPYDLFLLAVH